MKKWILGIGLATLTLVNVNAQSKKALGTKFSTTESVKQKPSMVIGSHEGTTYAYRKKGAVIYYIPFGVKDVLVKKKKGKVVKEVVLDKKNDKFKRKTYAMPELIQVGENLVEIAKNENKSTGKTTYYGVSYDKNLKESKPEKLFVKKFTKNSGDQLFNVSDEERIVFFDITSTGSRKTEVKIYECDADLELNEISSYSVRASTEEFDITRVLLSEDYVSFIEIEKDEDNVLKSSQFKRFNLKNGKSIEFELDFDEINEDISNYSFSVEEDVLAVSGFYESNFSEDNYGGAFTMTYDITSNEVIKVSKKAFTFDFITSDYSERASKRAAKRADKGKSFDNYSYIMDRVIANEDGSSYIIGQKYRYYVTTTTTSNGGTRTVPHYVYSDILVVKADRDGEIEWVNKYDRYTSTTNDNSGGLIVHKSRSDLSIVCVTSDGLHMKQINRESGKEESDDVFSYKELDKHGIMINNTEKIDETTFKVNLVRFKKQKVMTIEFS